MAMAKKVNMSDFKMLRTLGQGAFGRVNFARYEQDGKHYAVKAMSKHDIIKQKQVKQINSEKQIMAQIDHPFIVNMMGFSSDQRNIYIVMECITGGELFTHLSKARKFTDEQSKFYAAQVASAFAHIHSKNIIHRDLKPENILLMANGYSKLTDFGLAKVLTSRQRTFTFCGTPEYITPEVLLDKGYSQPVDWWSLGVLIYEMIVGQPPFCDEDTMGIYHKILSGKVYFPKYIDKGAKDLVKRLLTSDASKRLGSLKGGSDDVLQHKWFSSVDFDELENYAIPAPFKPAMKDDMDLSNFDQIPDIDELPPRVPVNQDPFVDW